MTRIIPDWLKPVYDAMHFAPAIIDGGYMRCSGMIGIRPDLTVPEDPQEQFTVLFENINKLLAEAGLGFADVIEVVSYHVNLQATMYAFAEVKDAFVPEPYPVWSAIGVSELTFPGALAELVVLAKKP